jgi:hypothetical protein
MILISHRGNIDGKQPNRENHPDYIEEALNLKFDVEVDVWYVDGELFLGHDEPEYKVDFSWFFSRAHQLWIHCKNVEAVQYFLSNDSYGQIFNFFWHEEDTITLTSMLYIWAYPGKQPIKGSIAVMPEINDDDITQCEGICSDYVIGYKNKILNG